MESGGVCRPPSAAVAAVELVGGLGSKVLDMGSSVVGSVQSMLVPSRPRWPPAHAELVGLAVMCVAVLLDAGAAPGG